MSVGVETSARVMLECPTVVPVVRLDQLSCAFFSEVVRQHASLYQYGQFGIWTMSCWLGPVYLRILLTIATRFGQEEANFRLFDV